MQAFIEAITQLRPSRKRTIDVNRCSVSTEASTDHHRGMPRQQPLGNRVQVGAQIVGNMGCCVVAHRYRHALGRRGQSGIDPSRRCSTGSAIQGRLSMRPEETPGRVCDRCGPQRHGRLGERWRRRAWGSSRHRCRGGSARGPKRPGGAAHPQHADQRNRLPPPSVGGGRPRPAGCTPAVKRHSKLTPMATPKTDPRRNGVCSSTTTDSVVDRQLRPRPPRDRARSNPGRSLRPRSSSWTAGTPRPGRAARPIAAIRAAGRGACRPSASGSRAGQRDGEAGACVRWPRPELDAGGVAPAAANRLQ